MLGEDGDDRRAAYRKQAIHRSTSHNDHRTAGAAPAKHSCSLPISHKVQLHGLEMEMDLARFQLPSLTATPDQLAVSFTLMLRAGRFSIKLQTRRS
jgi:hypothetical protein